MQLKVFSTLVLAASTVLALPRNHTDASVNAAIDAGTFKDPHVAVRPRFRYWVPDASVDNATLADDIAGAKYVGAGGVEVLGYYLYGASAQGEGDIVPVDWTVYGWGLPAWQGTFKTLLQAHKDNGLIMDFAMGPNQGQGVPAPYESEGLAWDLYSYNISVPIGGSFNGTLPGWGMGPLQGVVTGLVKSTVNITVPTSQPLSLNETGTYPSLPGDDPLNRTQATLANDSLTDVTSQVSADGYLSLNFPSDSDGLEYNIFVVYLIHSDYRAQQSPEFIVGPETAPTTWQQNGSWAVDHYSALGAHTTTNYWDQYILTDGVAALLEEVGNYGWEDSIEIRSNAYWTQNFTQNFTADHGYSIIKWLPLLFHQNDAFASNEYSTWWITDEADAGNSHIADYRQTLTHLYGDYIEALTDWAHETLNVQFSAQITYNLPLDMMSNIPNTDAPECESLGFNHLIDGYRQYSGPANLAGKRLVSTECGAIPDYVYQQTLPALLWDVKRSIVGSVTQFVFHGYPFSGYYGNTTWPGFTTFEYDFSEMHGPRQPAWDFYKTGLMDFTARLQYIFQSGVPKMDVAFYQKITTYPNIVRNYMPTDLEEAGYAYEYISPDNFDLPNAVVVNNTFAPAAQAFKAMIVRANDSMTVQGVAGLAEYAHAGLPIIFSGGLPTYLASYNSSGATYVTETLQSLTSLPNVHVIPYEPVAATLASLGIEPLTKVTANATWFTYWRRDDAAGLDYVFVYNDAVDLAIGTGYSEGTVEFASIGTPYLFDAWTGEKSAINAFDQSSSTTTISLHLAGNQSVIIAFADTGKELNTTKTNVIDDPSLPLPSASSEVYDLDAWTLVVEHWDPPANLSDNVPSATVKYNTTHDLTALEPWSSISGLQNVSGRGYYNTTFTWPPGASSANSTNTTTDSTTSSSQNAYIDFGAIFDTIVVTINGKTLPPLDPTWAKLDVSKYLVDGTNEVQAVVATTLNNVVRTIWTEIQTSGTGTNIPIDEVPIQEYGLVQPVRVVPFVV